MATPNERDSGGSAGLPGADGSEFFAPPGTDRRNQNRRATDRDATLGGRRTTDYKLSHRSKRDFPEAYEAVSKVFWEGLSQQQVDAVMRLQATAMEKAGFEKGTPKFFIDDFDPGNPGAAVASGGRVTGVTGVMVDGVTEAAPRLILGGVLLGMSALALALGILGLLAPPLPIIAASTVALITGAMLAFTGR